MSCFDGLFLLLGIDYLSSQQSGSGIFLWNDPCIQVLLLAINYVDCQVNMDDSDRLKVPTARVVFGSTDLDCWGTVGPSS